MVSISTITLHCHTCHLGVVIKENVIYFYRLHVTNCFLFSVYQSQCLINFSVYDINNICYSSQGAKDGRLFNEQNFLQRAAKPASGKGFNVSTIRGISCVIALVQPTSMSFFTNALLYFTFGTDLFFCLMSPSCIQEHPLIWQTNTQSCVIQLNVTLIGDFFNHLLPLS